MLNWQILWAPDCTAPVTGFARTIPNTATDNSVVFKNKLFVVMDNSFSPLPQNPWLEVVKK